MPGGLEALTTVIEGEKRAADAENRQLSEEEEDARQNSVRLAELQRTAAEAERAPKKERESFFGKIFRAVANTVGWLFGKYSSKGGERTDRSGNEFQNMLIAKTQFQQGGASAFAADTGDSLVMSAREGSENAVADFSMASIHKSNTDEGEAMEGGTVDITYKNKLKLIAPSADFKHRYLSDTTVAYSSPNVQLFFMSAFRDLSTKAAAFTIERNMSIGTDKFAEIASLEFDKGGNHVRLPDFVISDGALGPKMQFAGGKASITAADSFSVNAEGVTAGGGGLEPITTASAGIKFDAGLVGHNEEIPLSGGITLGETGIDGGGASFSLGKIENYKDIFGALDVNGALSNEADGSLGYKLGADKWVVHYADGLISMIKGGDSAELSLDAARQLHVISEAGVSIDLNILPLGLKIPTVVSGEKADFAIGDDSFSTTVERNELTLFGKHATGVSLGIAKTASAANVKLDAKTLDLGENISLANVSGSIGSDGLTVTGATLNMKDMESASYQAEGIVGTVTNLKVDKTGVTFDDISATVTSLSVGETFEADNIAAHISKTKEMGFGIKGEFTNLNAEIEPEDEGLNVDVKELSGAFEFNKQKKSIILNEKGHIDLTYGEGLFISLKGLGMSYSETGFEMSVGQGFGKYIMEDGASPFGGVLNFKEFTAHIQNVSVARRKMTVGEGGVFKLDFSDVEMFDKKIGDLSLSKTSAGFEGSVESEGGISKKFGDVELKLSGGIGFSYTSADGSFAPNLEEIKAEVSSEKIDVSIESLKMENKDTLVIGEIAAGLKSKSIFGNDDDTAGASVTVSELKIGKTGVSFKEIAATLNKTFTFWDEGLSIGNPKIGIVNNFSGFSLGGMVKVNCPYFETGAEGTVFFEKQNKFVPKLSSIKDFIVKIPNLAQLKIEETSFDTPDVIEFKKLKYESGFNPDGFKDKEGFFYQLCSLGKDIKINLAKAKYQNKKFDYDFADIDYYGSSFKQKFGPVEVSATFEKDSVTVGAAIELIMPKKPESADKLGKDSFTQLLSYGMSGPVCPFISFGADIFAGADLDLKGEAEAKFMYGEEKGFFGKLSATVEKAVAGVGVEGYASFGIPYVSELQLGVRGVLAGDLNGTTLEGKLGLNKDETGISINKDPDATAINANLNAKLAARLQAFVRPVVILMDKKDLLTFTIANVNLFSCKVGGKGSYQGNVWEFNKEGFTWSSDFCKDSFNPDDPKSLLSRSKQVVSDFKSLESAIAGTENAIGLQDWASEDALEKSVTLQSEIIPRLEGIRDKSKQSFALLTENDAKYAGEMFTANEHILKHKERLQNAELAKQGIAEAAKTQPIPAPAPVNAKAPTNAEIFAANAVRAENKRSVEAFVNTAGGLPPAMVWAYISRKFHTRTLSWLAQKGFASKVSDMQEQYVQLRRTIKEIGENSVSAAKRVKGALAGASGKTDAEKAKIAGEANKPIDRETLEKGYKTTREELAAFMKSGNEAFDKQAKLNDKPIKELQKVNLDIVKKNGEIEEKNKENKSLQEELERLINEADSYEKMKSDNVDSAKAKVAKKIEEQRQKILKGKRESDKLRDEKMELINELGLAREQVNTEALDAEKSLLSNQKAGFSERRGKVAEARKAYMGPEKVEALGLSNESYLPSEEALKESGIELDELKYDSTALAQFYSTKNVVGLGSDTTYQALTHKQFAAYSNIVIAECGRANVAIYNDYLKGLKLEEYLAQPTAQESPALLVGLFSSHAKSMVEGKKQALTMDNFAAYTQERIDAYESRKSIISGNEKELEDTIIGSTDLYNRAVDAFKTLNGVKREDFLAKSSFGGKNGTDSVTFSGNYRSQLNKLVVAEEQFESGEFSDRSINSFENKAESAIEKSKNATDVFEQIKNLNQAG